MNIPRHINQKIYQKCVSLFTRLFSDLEKTTSSSEAALSEFSRFFETSLPDELTNLTSMDGFFFGDKADQLTEWYSQLLEIWKDYQQLSLPFSQNLLDPKHNQKMNSLYHKLKSVKIE